MTILWRSRIYREEILRWALIGVLICWGLASTAWALTRDERIVIIAIDNAGVRLVTDQKDRLLQDEAVRFIQSFSEYYLNYDVYTYEERAGRAADFMSSELWGEHQKKFAEFAQKLKASPLSQTATVESIDLIGEKNYEVVALVTIKQKTLEKHVKVRMTIQLKARARTEENPWAFEMTGLRDELL